MSILGNRVTRIEDPRLLTSGGVYTADLDDPLLTGAAHVTFVRSSIAYGRIIAIDTEAARTAPGVLAVVTAADLDDVAPMSLFSPEWPQVMAQPVLARDTVRYVGEAVAAVVTELPAQGPDAAELVSVDIEPLPAVIGAREAAS